MQTDTNNNTETCDYCIHSQDDNCELNRNGYPTIGNRCASWSPMPGTNEEENNEIL